MRALALLVSLVLTVAACGGDGTEVARPTAGEDKPGSPATADRPAFLTIPLTDVRTGERFTLGGFEGKVTIVLAMAVW